MPFLSHSRVFTYADAELLLFFDISEKASELSEAEALKFDPHMIVARMNIAVQDEVVALEVSLDGRPLSADIPTIRALFNDTALAPELQKLADAFHGDMAELAARLSFDEEEAVEELSVADLTEQA